MLKIFQKCDAFEKITTEYNSLSSFKGRLRNSAGSQVAMLAALCADKFADMHIAILADREDAAYFYNDLSLFMGKSVQLL